ncbi:MAG: C39 family peptidase [Oscillospiraceae bacterium]|jgi:hypothetical protein|nr:C39 family peptidase [Oscillospiraceae bacterium]
MKSFIIRTLTFVLTIVTTIAVGTGIFAEALTVRNADDPRPTPIDRSDEDLLDSFPAQKPFARSGFSGARGATPEQIERAKYKVKEPTATQIERTAELHAEIEAQLNSIASGSGVGALAEASWIELSPFAYYPQQKNYTCGPASIRMALKWINGTTPSEATVEDGCYTDPSDGTYVVNMVDYINDMQDTNPYVGVYGASKSNMKRDLYECITDYECPPIVGLKECIGTGWPYILPGHFVTIYSVLSDKSYFELCDPWAGYAGDSVYRWYEKSANDLYSAYDDADNIGYMW